MVTLERFAWRSLTARRTRAVLTALAVALGVTVTVAAGVIGRSVTRYSEQLESRQSTAGILGAQLEQWLGSTGLVLLGVAAFLVYNAFAMSVTQRQRQVGLLRSLGMTRRQVMGVVLVEAVLMGVAGTGLGLLCGPLAGWGMVVLLGEYAGIAYQVSPPAPGSLLLAAALGLAVPCLAALLPARRAARIAPLEALRQRLPALTQTGPAARLAPAGVAVAIALFTVLALAPPATSLPATGHARLSWHDLLVGLCSLAWLASLGLVLPALIPGLGRWSCAPLSRLWGTAGRLAADNLRRDRGRVTRTILTLAIGVMTIVAITGALALLSQSMLSYYTSVQIPPRWGVFAGSLSGDLASWQTVSELDLSAFGFPDSLRAEIVDAFGARADVLAVRAAIVPELDVVPGSMSFFFDAQRMRRMALFDFNEGDWETALPLLEQGCGVLITPGLARRHGVWLYDTLSIPGREGPVECTVAGLGLSANFGASLIGDGSADLFHIPERPFALFLQPTRGTDVTAFETDLDAFVQRHTDLYTIDLREADDFMETMVGGMLAILNGPLLLAIAVAALGVVNTTAISVAERRRELGLLRAAGATRRQVRIVVTGEAALMGLAGGALGLLAGAGLVAIRVLAGDHSTWGVRDAVLGTLFANVLHTAVLNGLASAVAAPFICALAAWLPARSILRGTALETMDALRTPCVPRSAIRGGAKVWRGPVLLAWRNLDQSRARTVLSALAVALGVATTIAAGVVSSGILNAIRDSEVAQTLMSGLLDQLDRMLTLVGVGITLAAGFLVLNAFAMSVTQQRRQVGMLRSLGATRRQVMRTVLLEALITGAAGTLAGAIAGPALGQSTIALMRALLGDVFVFETSGASPASLALAAALGMGIALLAVTLPARRAARIPPLAALRQPSVPGVSRRALSRARGGLAVLAVLVACLALAPPGEWATAPWNTVLTVALALLWLAGLAQIAPALVDGVARWLQRPLTRLWGATGRLIADNLRRGRGRVTLTVLTIAVALALIVGLTGFIRFMYYELLYPKLVGTGQLGAWLVTEADFISGMGEYVDVENLTLSPAVIEALEHAFGARARTLTWQFVVVPELSFWGSSYFSFLMDPHAVRQAGDAFFTYTEGDWNTALAAMDPGTQREGTGTQPGSSGCAVLVAPAIATRNGVSLGESFEVTGRDGPVTCTVAGIGAPYVGASIISLAARDSFDAPAPIGMLVWPAPGIDRGELEADLRSLLDAYPGAGMRELDDMAEMQTQVMDALPDLLSALLLLAFVAAALGVVNTTLISVSERRHELGLFRAVGATRRQVGAVVAGEAALMGATGAALGLVAGAGVVVIVAVTYGGRSWGVVGLDLWPAAWRSVRHALTNGLIGLVAAPLVCALAAWLPARSILRGTPVEALRPGRRAH